jgi:DNA polymerase-3 subunit delta'
MIGHDAAWAAWQDALSGERMHHAWLLAGKSGLGKMHFALAAARTLVGAATDVENHPDIHVLTHLPKDDKEERKREEGKPFEVKRNITIGQIRAMQQRLTTRPTMGARRAIIVDPADDMERNASNALLKSLEEPPVGTFFLLVSHRPAKLLPTIRSRCRTLRFHALKDAEIAELLARQASDTNEATRAAAVTAAAGSPGRALAFVELGLGPVAQILRLIAEQGDPEFTLRGELVAAIGTRPDRARLDAVLELARSILDEGLADADPRMLPARIAAHAELVRLSGEMPTYNYDAGLLVMEIGTLLAGAAQSSGSRHG